MVKSWLITAAILARPPAVAPATTVKELHQTMIKPASEAIFNVGREVPKTDEEWTAIARAGVTLAESGRRLMPGSPVRNDRRWIHLSRQLAAAGRTATRAAAARNLTALTRASDRLVIVCETCHAPYRSQTPK